MCRYVGEERAEDRVINENNANQQIGTVIVRYENSGQPTPINQVFIYLKSLVHAVKKFVMN